MALVMPRAVNLSVEPTIYHISHGVLVIQGAVARKEKEVLKVWPGIHLGNPATTEVSLFI